MFQTLLKWLGGIALAIFLLTHTALVLSIVTPVLAAIKAAAGAL